MFDGIPYVPVYLTQDQVAKISPDDATAVLAHKWLATKCMGKWYAARFVELPRGHNGRRRRRKIYLHRFLAGDKPRTMVDHFDGDGLNCQRDNLLVCSKYWNSHNRDADIGVSKFRGVSLATAGKKHYRARITHEGIEYHCGTYLTAIEAAEAYDAKAIELFGPYARTNLREGRLNRSNDLVKVFAQEAVEDAPF